MMKILSKSQKNITIIFKKQCNELILCQALTKEREHRTIAYND